MRNTFLSIAAILTIIGAQGRTLTPAEALTRVQADNTATKAPAVRAVESAEPRLVLTQTTEAGLPAVYVFENSDASSLVLVSADDVATPLLGYTDRAEADVTDMPPQLKWWLEEYARQIEYAQLNGTVSSSSRDAESQITAKKTYKIVAAPLADKRRISPLVKTTWNQSAPYNNFCPTQALSGAAPTGCVATAMAQVMYYFMWPTDAATGSGKATYNDTTYTLDLSTITFDWGNMLEDYPTATSGTDQQRNAVATLMQACGYSVSMQYESSTSGAVTADCIAAFTKNFGYDAGAFYAYREDYSRDEWADLIYNNILNAGPVLYSGRSTTGGHAFICDGYNTDGLFHFNWGWGGSYNGYYTLQALNPNGQGIGGFAGGYNFMQAAAIGIQKPTGTVQPTPTILPQLTTQTGLTGSIDSSDGTLTIGGGMYNFTGNPITVDIYVKCTSTESKTELRKKIFSDKTFNNGSGYNSFYFSYASLGLSDGTYDVTIETTEPGNTNTFYPLLAQEGASNYFTLTKEGTTYTVTNYDFNPPTVAKATVTYTELFSDIYLGLNNILAVNPQVSFSVSNESETEVMGGIAFQLVKNNKVYAVSTGAFYDLLAGETQDYDLSLELTRYTYSDGSKLTIGETYDLYVYNPNVVSSPTYLGSSTKLDNATVTIKNYPKCTLEFKDFSIDGNPNDVNTLGVNFKGSVGCSSGFYNNLLTAGIFPESGGTSLYLKTFAPLNVSENQTADFSGTLYCNLDPNTRYFALLYYIDYSTNTRIQLSPSRNYLYFTTGNSMSDVAAIESESPEGVHIGFDNATRTLMVCAGNEVKAMTIVAMNGSQIYVPTDFNGDTAFADLSGLTAGIYVVRAVDAAGNTATEKIAIR